MVNVGLLTVEIGSGLGSFGTPANFNGFRFLATLLHGTLVVGVSQTAALKGASPIFGRAAITFGVDPHSSSKMFMYLSLLDKAQLVENVPNFEDF